MTAGPRFTPDLFHFLTDLSANNDRAWFKEHQARYDEAIKEPALEFIEAFRPRLAAISPHFEANARAVGGSLFRIQRDTRFAKDKTPYKTNTGLHFRHERAGDAHAPGYYLHLEPGNCFMGFGLWMPPTAAAYRIRHWIADHDEAWTSTISDPTFAGNYTLGGDSLARPPKGFDPDHPLITDLKRKSFMAAATLTQREVTSKDFLDRFTERCEQGSAFMRLLCEAVDLQF